jgi:glutaredoxin
MSMRRLLLNGATLITAAFLATAVGAQTTYRWVDKTTGQTIFSDQPPPPGARNVATTTRDERADDSPLPYATRIAVEKFPVTLYTAANCADACRTARELLNGRGVPFTEILLKSPEDIDQLSKKMGGDPSVPSLSVGQQNFKGFEAGSWNNLLDLAGYPASAPYGSKPSGAFAR